jgi:hypothetical protein
MTPTPSPQRAAQIADIERALTVMFDPGSVVELRALYGKGRTQRIDSGYFSDFHALAEEAARLDNARDPAPMGVYVSLNRLDPSLLARSPNVVEARVGEGATTSDKHITRLRWLLVDCDPVRVSGISSSNDELAAATRRAAQVEARLTAQGWPAPLRAMSGNGAHRLYRIDLPNTPDSVDLVKRCLAALASQFDDDAVTIDPTVFNPARIVKVYGTTARKGADVDDRPHRRAELTHAPGAVQVVDQTLLEALAALAPVEKGKTPKAASKTPTPRRTAPDDGEYWHAGTPDAVDAWAAGHGLTLRAKGVNAWQVDCLTCNGAHADGAALFLTDGGYLRYKCHHASCSGASIADVLTRYPAPTTDRPQRQTPTKGDDDELTSERIEADLREWGYRLWLNDLDDCVWDGDKRFDDVARAVLRLKAYDAGYGDDGLLDALDSAVVALAATRRRHPLRTYLGALTWDGCDHIAKLAGYVQDRHAPVTYADGTVRKAFHAFLVRWLVGSVAKIHGDRSAAMGNFILTLAGNQNLGKSHLAQWLCPLDGFFISQGIHPDSKDSSLRRTVTWVWEIGELGATTRRADVESLKGFVTSPTATERRPYARFDLEKPAIASYIGTVNDDGAGFLSDSTGNRRFVVVDLAAIDWRYESAVDPAQVWAQAMTIWRENPKAYILTTEEQAFRDRNNEAHAEHDQVADMLSMCIEKDPNGRVRSSRVLEILRTYGGLSRGNDKALGKDIARALRKYWGIDGTRSNGATWYLGVRVRDDINMARDEPDAAISLAAAGI